MSTVHPASPFDPIADAEVLRKAMKGFGTDEKAIINVIARRTNCQRLDIVTKFKTMYGKDLIKELKSELSGNLENVIIALMTPLYYFYAEELKRATAGIGTTENTLIEILGSLPNSIIQEIKCIYHKKYGDNLESVLKGDTSGFFKRLMVSLCNASRNENRNVDINQAKADAEKLHKAGVKKFGTDESTFIMILCERSFPQLAQTFVEYERLAGHAIEKDIKKEFSGAIEDGLLAIVAVTRNSAAYFAKLLHNSMKGLGTKDKNLIRLVVTRSEVDMVCIKEEYVKLFKHTLAHDIKGDCSGDYKHCLLTLIGEE